MPVQLVPANTSLFSVQMEAQEFKWGWTGRESQTGKYKKLSKNNSFFLRQETHIPYM